MNKFIVLAAVVTLVAGEAPAHVGLSSFGGGSSGSGINEYVDEALLARVGELISRGGDGSGTPQGTEGLNLDSEILTRVSGSIGGDSSGPSSSYGPPSRSSSMLGQPEPAERIAEFDLESAVQQRGYDSAPAPSYGAPAPSYGAPAPDNSYGPPAPTPVRSGSSGQISLGRPMPVQRVADFSVSGGSAPVRSSGYA